MVHLSEHMNSQDYNEDKAICGKALDFPAPAHSALAGGHESKENYQKPHYVHLEKDNKNARVHPFSSTGDHSFKLLFSTSLVCYNQICNAQILSYCGFIYMNFHESQMKPV